MIKEEDEPELSPKKVAFNSGTQRFIEQKHDFEGFFIIITLMIFFIIEDPDDEPPILINKNLENAIKGKNKPKNSSVFASVVFIHPNFENVTNYQ